MSLLLTAHLQHATKGLALDLSFSIGAGTTALFGPSGAGKSTLLRMLAGLARPQRGFVSLNGRVLVDTGRERKRRVVVPPGKRGIGYQTQSAVLFPHLSVEQNIQFGLQGRLAGEKADEVIRLMELADLRGRKPQSLSGGERQRVALARTLVRQPALLLLDEPFSALDNENKAALWAALSAYCATHGISALLVSHDAAEVWQHAERVVRMSDGKIVGEGTPAEMMQRERRRVLTQFGVESAAEQGAV